MRTIPKSFIDEEIEVQFDEPLVYEKRPSCPQAFTWCGVAYAVISVLSEEQDFSRHGRSARNMQSAHLESATKVGSWGVGRYTFCVQVPDGRVFDIYFDRAPQNAGDRKGHWFIKGERQIIEEN